ncbi:MAG: alpha/beta hydrolase [Nitrospiraceae bacterium]
MLDQLFVYHPAPWNERNWAAESGLPLEDVWFRTPAGAMRFGWYVHVPQSEWVLLWCHGNAGNIADRLGNLRLLVEAGLSVFLFDYGGYGRSPGRPSEAGLYADALAAYDHVIVRRGVRPDRVALFGRSLGGAVAGEVVVQRPIGALILESTFPSIEAVAKTHYWGLPVHWLLGARFQLDDRVRTVCVPTLVVHGDRDDIIPIQLGRAVYDALGTQQKTWYAVSGADHNNVLMVGGQAYLQRLLTFLRSVRQRA